MSKLASCLFLSCLLLIPMTAGAQDAVSPGMPAPPGVLEGAMPVTDTNYRCAPDDVLQLTVWGEPAIQGVYLIVTPEGTINAPVIGTIQAAGRTIDEIKADIAQKFIDLDYLRNPTVQLTLYQVHKMRVRVLGQVQRPGLQQMRDGDTVDHAIAEAGGFIPDMAALSRTTLTRIGEPDPVPIDLEAFFYDGDLSQNFRLKDGDTIYIPEDTQNRFYVLGYVQRPTQYPLKRTTTVTQAITQAGGAIQRGALGRTVVIRKGQDGEAPQRIPVDVVKILNDGDTSRDILLEPEDVVFVPETKSPDLQRIGQILNAMFNVAYLNRIGWW